MKVRDQVVTVLLLLESGEHHLGAGDILLGVDQVLVQGVLAPGDTLVDVSLKVFVGIKVKSTNSYTP